MRKKFRYFSTVTIYTNTYLVIAYRVSFITLLLQLGYIMALIKKKMYSKYEKCFIIFRLIFSILKIIVY